MYYVLFYLTLILVFYYIEQGLYQYCISAGTRLLRPKSDDGDILLTAQLIAGCRGVRD